MTNSRVGQRLTDLTSRAGDALISSRPYQLASQTATNALDRLRTSRFGEAVADARVALGSSQMAELYRTNPREWNRLARGRLGATLGAMADNAPPAPAPPAAGGSTRYPSDNYNVPASADTRPANRPSNYGPRSAGTGARRPTQQRPSGRRSGPSK